MDTKTLNISLREYLADPAPAPSLTRSLIVTLQNGSPYSAWYEHPRLNPQPPDDESNKRADMGKAAHDLLLEGGNAFTVIDAKDYRTKAAQALRDAAYESGRTPLLTSEHEAVQPLVQRSRDALEARGIDLTAGEVERSIIWHNGACWLRTRPDWKGPRPAGGRLVLEYKTTELSPGQWKRAMASKGYDIQAWMHRMGVIQEEVQAYDPSKRYIPEFPEVLFMVQQTKAPFEVFFVGLSEMYYELAARKIGRAADIWRQCLEAGKWPSYPLETEIVDPFAWQIAAEEEREIEHQTWTPEAFLFGQVRD